MNAVTVIAVWGVVALVAAITAGIVAAAKNRDHSWWAAWSFVVPPMLLILVFLPRNTGPRPRRPPMDDDDRDRGWV
jgi:apolipoprotein N-acyltransferase